MSIKTIGAAAVFAMAITVGSASAADLFETLNSVPAMRLSGNQPLLEATL